MIFGFFIYLGINDQKVSGESSHGEEIAAGEQDSISRSSSSHGQ